MKNRQNLIHSGKRLYVYGSSILSLIESLAEGRPVWREESRRPRLLKVTRWKNGFIQKLHCTANLNFHLLLLFVYLLNNSSSFSYWESAEPVFSIEQLDQLSSFQKPKQKHDSQFLGGKIQICCIARFFL